MSLLLTLWALLAMLVPAQGLLVSDVNVTYGDTAYLAEYRPSSHTVVLDRSLWDKPRESAALLAHELVHAGARGQGDCFTEEVKAFTVQAGVWEELRDGPADTVVERQLDNVYFLWRANLLEWAVRGSPVYQAVCGGR